MTGLDEEIAEVFRVRSAWDLFRDMSDMEEQERGHSGIAKHGGTGDARERWRARQIQDGRCTLCNQPASAENKRLCSYHRRLLAEHRRQRRLVRKF